MKVMADQDTETSEPKAKQKRPFIDEELKEVFALFVALAAIALVIGGLAGIYWLIIVGFDLLFMLPAPIALAIFTILCVVVFAND